MVAHDWALYLKSKADFAPLEPACANLFAAWKLGSPLAIGVSGGADSIYLLLRLWVQYPLLRSCLHVLHFNHQLRGADSEGDAEWVKHWAANLSLPIAIGLGNGQPQGEAGLREERHAFFKQRMREIGSTHLVLGHHLDDVAETVLMRLSRGSGAVGLSAPRPIHSHDNGQFIYLRPLLSVRRATIEAHLAEAELGYRTDSSNAANIYYRNALRNQLLPVWEKLAPAPVASGIARSRQLLAEDDSALDVWLDAYFDWEGSFASGWSWVLLVGKPAALHRRALWRVLLKIPCDAELTAKALDALVTSLYTGASFRQSYGAGFLVFHSQKLFFELSASEKLAFGPLPLVLGGVVAFPPGGSVRFKSIDAESHKRFLASKPDWKHEIHLPYSIEGQPVICLVVRSWNKGDASKPLGLGGSKKLQDQFVDRKVPSSVRTILPVVTTLSGAILWTPGLVPSQLVHTNPSNLSALSLTYHKEP